MYGEVFGLTVRSRNIGSQMGAGLKSMLGGELKGMTKALVQSREDVIARMVEEAEAKGANAIVAMRFDTSEMGGTWTEICAYGTAVRAASSDPVALAIMDRAVWVRTISALAAAFVVVGAAAAATGDPGTAPAGPTASAHAQAVRIVLPNGKVVGSGGRGRRPDEAGRSDGESYSYPGDGSVVVTGGFSASTDDEGGEDGERSARAPRRPTSRSSTERSR